MSSSRPTAAAPHEPLVVIPDAEGCRIAHRQSGLAFRHSFVSGELRRRARQPGQALLRACRDRKRHIQSVLDATAGWGGDSLTLAAHGLTVTMLERQRQIHDVLQLALATLATSGQTELVSRLRLQRGDAYQFLVEQAERVFDCIYLDPMFPARSSGAKPGKSMQILQAITTNFDIERFFELALTRARYRVVVKRPARAPRLDSRVPDIVYREKTVRFDVYLAA
ncbi:MAG: class I SAM-dependent methyltransferase [Gammaproteobacteria bacterium]|nr:class I SAM-dependent methyltransferase [Gammaproteobacteria bacterium]